MGAKMSNEYQISRRNFIFESAAAVGVFSLTTGAFLTGYLKNIGFSDELTGLMGAIPVLTGIIQIFSFRVFEPLEKRKPLIAVLSLIFRVLLGFMFFIPLLIQSPIYKIALVIIIYFIAYSIAAFIGPPTSEWIVDVTPMDMRGSYFAKRDACALGFLTVLTLIFGKILDVYKNTNNSYGGFIVVGIAVIIMAAVDFYYLLSITEPKRNKEKITMSMKGMFIKVLKHQEFRKVIILSILWNISFQIAGPFFSVYMVVNLKLAYSYIMILGVIGSLSRVLTVKVWGKMADKRGWTFVTKVSLAMLAITNIIWFFVDARTAVVLLPIINFIGGITWGGLGIALFNIQFVYAPEDCKIAYIGISGALGSVLGFISTYIGALLLRALGDTGFRILSINISNIQILFILSGILLLLTAGYVNKTFNEN